MPELKTTTAALDSSPLHEHHLLDAIPFARCVIFDPVHRRFPSRCSLYSCLLLSLVFLFKPASPVVGEKRRERAIGTSGYRRSCTSFLPSGFAFRIIFEVLPSVLPPNYPDSFRRVYLLWAALYCACNKLLLPYTLLLVPKFLGVFYCVFFWLGANRLRQKEGVRSDRDVGRKEKREGGSEGDIRWQIF